SVPARRIGKTSVVAARVAEGVGAGHGHRARTIDPHAVAGGVGENAALNLDARANDVEVSSGQVRFVEHHRVVPQVRAASTDLDSPSKARNGMIARDDV